VRERERERERENGELERGWRDLDRCIGSYTKSMSITVTGAQQDAAPHCGKERNTLWRGLRNEKE